MDEREKLVAAAAEAGRQWVEAVCKRDEAHLEWVEADRKWSEADRKQAEASEALIVFDERRSREEG
jgi:hypothetical protein